MKSLFLFYVLSLTTALSNYFFQASAAKLLGQESYSLFMSEWSLVNVLMFFGSLASFWAALGKNDIKKVWFLSGTFFVLSAVLYFMYAHGLHWALSWSLIIAFVAQSFLLGHWLGGGRRFAFCLLSLLTSVLKLGLIFLVELPSTTSFFSVIILSLFVSTAIVGAISILRNDLVVEERNSQGWLAAVLLAMGTHFLPNSDMLWLRYFATAEELQSFSPLTLVTRAIFFLQVIFAQWWLSESVEKIKFNTKTFLGLLLVSTFASSSVGLLIRFVVNEFLDWKIIPDSSLFLLAGIHAAAAGIFFQFLQLRLVRGENTVALIMSLAMIAPWAITGFVQLRPILYLLTSASIFLCVIVLSQFCSRAHRDIL